MNGKKRGEIRKVFFSSNEFHTTITIRNNNRVPSRYFLLPRFFAKIPKVLALSDTCSCFCYFDLALCITVKTFSRYEMEYLYLEIPVSGCLMS